MERIARLLRHRIVRTGGPFFTLMLVGVVGLKQLTSVRYEFSNKGVQVREEIEKAGIAIKKPGEVTLETEYDKIKGIDIDSWESVRIPRPWEPLQ